MLVSLAAFANFMFAWIRSEEKKVHVDWVTHIWAFLILFGCAFGIGVGASMGMKNGWAWRPILISIAFLAAMVIAVWYSPVEPILMTALFGFWAAAGLSGKRAASSQREPGPD